MALQERNQEMIDLLTSDFQIRAEPNFAWVNACAAHLALPGLRAFWPMSSVDYAAANRARDISGGAYHLTQNNQPDFSYGDLVPYAMFNGVNQYLSRADGGGGNWADITGTEAYITGTKRGLSIGGWFYIQAWQGLGTQPGLITKWDDNAVNQRSYMLSQLNLNQFQFLVSVDGAAVTGVISTVTGTANNWYHVVGTFDPSTQLAIYINGVKTTLAVGIPASIFNSTALFGIGWQNSGAGVYYQGYASLCWLSAMWYDDPQVLALYEQTRALFGVGV